MIVTEIVMENEKIEWPISLGFSRTISAREPLILSGQDNAWYVSCGEVHLFLHETEDGKLQNTRIPLFTVEQGGLIVGFPQPEQTDSWVVVGIASIDTSIASFTLENFFESIDDNLPRGESLLGQWLRRLDELEKQGTEPHEKEETRDNPPFVAREMVHAANKRFFQWALTLAEKIAVDWEESFVRREQAKKNIMETAVATMKDTIQGKTSFSFDPQADNLLNACSLVLKKLGVSGRARLKEGPTGSGLANIERLRIIAENSGFRLRKIALDRGAWWRQNGTPMVAFKEKGDEPVALIPTDKQSYNAI